MQCICFFFRKLLYFVFFVYEIVLIVDSEDDDDDLGFGKNDIVIEQVKLDNKIFGKLSIEFKFDIVSKILFFGFGKVFLSIVLFDLGKEGLG